MRIAGFMLTTRLVIIGILNDLTVCLCSQPKQKSIRIAKGVAWDLDVGPGTWNGTLTSNPTLDIRLKTGLILFMSRLLAISRNNHAHKWPVKCWPDLSGQLHFIFHLSWYLQNMRESGANKKLSNRFCRCDNAKVLKYFKMRQS